MSDDSDIREYTRRGAVGLMGVGGALAVTETFGFTRLTADRDTQLTVEADDDTNVALQVTDSDGNPIGDEYTLPDDDTEQFTIGVPSDVALDALTVDLSGSNRSGSGTVSVVSTDGFDTNDESISDSDPETLENNGNFNGNGSFSLSIRDSVTDGSDDRDALDLNITVTANLGGTHVELTRTTTIQDQQ